MSAIDTRGTMSINSTDLREQIARAIDPDAFEWMERSFPRTPLAYDDGVKEALAVADRVLALLHPAPLSDAMVEQMARAHDAEDAAQRGEPSPWDIPGDDFGIFRLDRIAAMRAAAVCLPLRTKAGFERAMAELQENMSHKDRATFWELWRLYPGVFTEALALPTPTVGEGWQVVPVEPTEAMLEAFAYAFEADLDDGVDPALRAWRSALSASPREGG